MYEAYATTADLALYLGIEVGDLPADAARLINRASDQIYSAVKNNYDSTDDDHVAAIKMAVCAQVESMTSGNEEAIIAGGSVSESIGKTSISFGGAGVGTSATKSICLRARQYLNDFGLLYAGARMNIFTATDVDNT